LVFITVTKNKSEEVKEGMEMDGEQMGEDGMHVSDHSIYQHGE
jgi:hypothetical protein